MAFTIRGIGVMDYGKRDFHADGSYVTTQWFVVFYVPIVPMMSKRLRATGEVKYYSIHRRPVIAVLEKTKPHLQQVLSVYAFFAVEVVVYFAAGIYHAWWPAAIGLLLFAVPWQLRKRAVERVRLAHSREALGLAPESLK